MRFRLIYELSGKREEYTILKDWTNIGRGPDNDLVLTDFGISRRHCRILLVKEGLEVEDLGSRNGTQVNGTKVDRAPLKNGDRITLGRFHIRIQTDEASQRPSGEIVLEDRPFLDSPGTIIKPLTELFDDITKKQKEDTAKDDLRGIRLGNMLQILSEVARTLISADSLDAILNNVMNLTFQHLQVERGFLMLYDDEAEELRPVVIKQRIDDENQIVISKTISEKVFKEQVSILTSDATIDPRFSGSESIIFQGIRSAMCVPLWNQGEVVGVLHVDSLMANTQFTSDDLDFLTALANYSAVAIQRARLHERVQQEMEARSKLSRYHSPGVVTKILASRGVTDTGWNIEAQGREVSVLFADIVGFTSISEKLSPAEVAAFLNYYFSQMTSIIFRYEGTLDKFIGDALMAVFGAPIAQDDHAFRAVSAALEMQEEIAKLQFKEELDLDLDFHVRIGINSGVVVAGDIGSPQRMEYTVIGDTVNAASRIEEDIATPDEVAIGEDTWKSIKKKFKFEEMGKLILRGREEPLRCFRVLGKK